MPEYYGGMYLRAAQYLISSFISLGFPASNFGKTKIAENPIAAAAQSDYELRCPSTETQSEADWDAGQRSSKIS